MSLHIHTLEHDPNEGPGAIDDWINKSHHQLSRNFVFKNHPFPDSSDFDWLVIMGGPMNVDEESLYPWLAEEKRFIQDAIRAGKTVIGICLGAQLIARALGAQVTKNHFREIGWFPVRLTPEAKLVPLLKNFSSEFTPLHWHGDTFSIPEGAIRIAESEACSNQGFIYKDKVIGLQFHIEATQTILNDWTAALKENKEVYIQTKEVILSLNHFITETNQILFDFLDRLSMASTRG
jgi:GMP synthase-like glutamine amidotransferase